MEEMNNSTVNVTTSAARTNSFGLMDYLELCVYCINFIFGFPTHSYVLWLIVTGPQSGIVSGFFNLNFSVCEVVNCLNSLFIVVSFWFTGFTTLQMVLQGLVFTGRPLFQCLICAERYLAVVYPVTFLKYKPLRYRVICCTAVWITSLGSCLCCIFIMIFLEIKVYKWFFSLQFLLFFLIQLFCLVAVRKALKQSGPGDRRREEENHMKRRALYLILITTVGMTVVYVPFIITGFFSFLMQRKFFELWNAGLAFYVLAGFVHPVLYLHRI